MIASVKHTILALLAGLLIASAAALVVGPTIAFAHAPDKGEEYPLTL